MGQESSIHEKWKKLPGFKRPYYVSNLGRLRRGNYTAIREQNGIIVKQPIKARFLVGKSLSISGYERVCLEGKQLLVHRLVASVFCSKPIGADCINHLDANRLNNHASNLEWTTREGNNAHAKKLGLLRPHHKPRRDFSKEEILEIRTKLKTTTIQKAALFYKISFRSMMRIKLRQTYKNY